MAEPTEKEKILRDPLALAMIAAWVNVPVDKLPASMNAHTCTATMEAWKRVGEAALEYHRAEANAQMDQFIKGTYYDD